MKSTNDYLVELLAQIISAVDGTLSVVERRE